MRRLTSAAGATLMAAALALGSEAAGQGQADAAPAFLQPFNLAFTPHDLHTIAWIEGHPEYEAVEAMIGRPGEGPPRLNVIITRHDQTQIDHLTDERAVREREQAGTKREFAHRPVTLSCTEGPMPNLRFELQSFKNEPIVYDFHAFGPPQPGFGGLIDPGRHAETTSFPVMTREKSTAASPKTRVAIGGTDYKVSRGFLSENFSIGVIRAGLVETVLERAAGSLQPGAEWVVRRGPDRLSYRIAERSGETVRIEQRAGMVETIRAKIDGNRLLITEIRTAREPDAARALVLAFSPHLPALDGQAAPGQASFTLGTAAQPRLVSGTVSVRRDGGNAVLRLAPRDPEWAAARPITLRISQPGGGAYRVETVLGAGAGPAASAAGAPARTAR